MSRLFVANCTRQNREIHYRLDFVDDGTPRSKLSYSPAKRQIIPAGRQINLGGDLHMNQITDIVDQLKKFGLEGVVDVPRLKKATPYVFNIDKSVPAAAIRTVMNINAGILVEQGKKRRERAAIVANEMVGNTVTQEFANAGITKEPEQEVEVEFEQLEQSEAGESTIAEGYKVDAAAPAPQQSARKGRNRNRKQ